MARVVQRRKAPPYLLIVVIMLLVAAITLAAVFHNKYSKADRRRVNAEASLNEAKASLNDRDTKDIPALVNAISRRAISAAAAVEEAEALLRRPEAKPYVDGGLVSVIQGLIDQDIKKRDIRIAQLQANTTRLQNSLAQTDTDLKKCRADSRRQQDADAAVIKAAQDRLAREIGKKDAQLRRLGNEKDGIISDKDQKIAVMDQQMEELRNKLKRKDGIIEEYKARFGKPKPDTLTKVDGKISRSYPEQGICYVNLGQKERISRGLSFSVFSARAGVSKETPAKAKIVVISVGETISECRIVASNADDPVVEDDLIINVAYDATRIHRFVVEGDFDLYGRGKPSERGNDEVTKLIEDWGAKVSNTVTLDVDYVLMGSEPAVPTKPATDAPPQEWELYRQAMEKYQHYRNVEDTARERGVTILNTTQFLVYTGFAPEAGD